MSHKKTFPLFILIFIFLAACSGASFEDAQSMREVGGANQEAPAEIAMDIAVEEVMADGESISFTSQPGTNQEAAQLLPNDLGRLIIRNASLNLTVAETEETLADITQMAAQNGGWVVSSNVYQYTADTKSADITIRIPAAGFNDALVALKGLAVEVDNENVSGQDVTEEFVDLDARLTNLEATAARVRSFLDAAETVEEALAVNQELSRLEGEIEMIRGRMQFLSQSATFSTISVFLTPDIVAQPVQVRGWRPVGVAKEAIEALATTLQVLASFAIWFVIYILPVALIFGVPAWLFVRFIWRRWQRRRAKLAPTAPVTE